jgi:tetratricopeptide (TPR) repeat protein
MFSDIGCIIIPAWFIIHIYIFCLEIKEGDKMSNRFGQWWKNFLAESYSRLRWIFQFALPRGIVWPFRKPFFDIIYSLSLAALVLFYIPVSPVRNFIEKAMLDFWKNYVGEGSAAELGNVIGLFHSEWVLPILLVLIVWGLIAWLWARPRQQFFDEIREAGIIVLRGPGERSAFLNRIQREGISGLGLGPTAKLLQTYIPQKEDPILREKIRAIQQSKGTLSGLLITGKATSGKTRTAMELISGLRPSLVFIWRQGLEGKDLSNLHKWMGSGIIFADNLLLKSTGGENPLPDMLSRLLGQCPGLQLVGTIRKERLPEDRRGLEFVELGEIEQDYPYLIALAEEVALAESAKKRIRISKEEILHRFNGHPGGLVAGVDAMRDLYRELELESQAVLQAARLLWEMGIQDLLLERVWETAKLINGSEFAPVKQKIILENLKNEGFINLPKIGRERIEIYEAYLDEVIIMPPNREEMEGKTYDGWIKREDGYALVGYGYALTDPSTLRFQQDPQNFLILGIASYGEALHFYTPEGAPLDYAMTQNNLGTAYRALAAYQEPAENLQRAIQAYGEALRFYTPEGAPLDYAMTQNNLGNAYRALAAHQEPAENLQRTIQAYGEALHFYTPERAPLDYAMTQNNLGNAYGALAAHKEPAENLRRAIQAYEEALRFYTPERAPLEYAMTQNNLGTAYGDLAAHQAPAENLQRAIQAHGEALKYRTPERSPLDYAATQNNLGIAYGALAAHQEPAENLQRAIQAYEEALHFYTPERAPLDYAATQNNLGIAYGALAAHQEPAENLQRAIQAYGEALKYRTPERAPLKYAMTQNNLGTAYSDLAAHQEPAENLQRAIQAYEEALKYRTPERSPLDYAATQNNLGTAYGDLAAHQEPAENLQRAIQAYEEALKYRTPERSPLDYAMTQNNLGTTYGALAAHQEPAENLQRAIQAYEEALKYRTPERAPLKYAMTQNNLGTAYRALAAHQDEKQQACDLLKKALAAYEEALRYMTSKMNSRYNEIIIANQKKTLEEIQKIGC